MKNLAFHSLLWWKIITLPILTTSPIHFSLNRKVGRMYFLNLGANGLSTWVACWRWTFGRGNDSWCQGIDTLYCVLIMHVWMKQAHNLDDMKSCKTLHQSEHIIFASLQPGPAEGEFGPEGVSLPQAQAKYSTTRAQLKLSYYYANYSRGVSWYRRVTNNNTQGTTKLLSASGALVSSCAGHAGLPSNLPTGQVGDRKIYTFSDFTLRYL